MRSTKEKILESAIDLFNNFGIINVRLQQIADSSGISVGNLAYHYYSKKAIVEAIDEQLEHEIMPLLTVDPNFPNLLDFNNHLSSFYHLLNQFSFYFLDVLELERAYPKLHSKRKEYISKILFQIESWLDLNEERGIITSQRIDDQHKDSALVIWMVMTFWLTQKKVRDEITSDEGSFKRVIWNQLIPQFTEIGYMEFEAFILPQLENYSI